MLYKKCIIYYRKTFKWRRLWYCLNNFTNPIFMWKQIRGNKQDYNANNFTNPFLYESIVDETNNLYFAFLWPNHHAIHTSYVLLHKLVYIATWTSTSCNRGPAAYKHSPGHPGPARWPYENSVPAPWYIPGPRIWSRSPFSIPVPFPYFKTETAITGMAILV